MNQAALPSRKVKALLRRMLAALAVLIGALVAYAGYTIHNANFHAIVSGEAYRSGQMDAAQLSRFIQAYGIKSIINLRGTNAPVLYQGEMETAKRLGVQHYDFSLSAIDEITVPQMDEIIRTLRAAPKPVLIHSRPERIAPGWFPRFTVSRSKAKHRRTRIGNFPFGMAIFRCQKPSPWIIPIGITSVITWPARSRNFHPPLFRDDPRAQFAVALSFRLWRISGHGQASCLSH